MGNLGDDAIVAAAKSAMPSRRLIDLNYASRERNLAQLGLSGATYFESVILGGGTLISPNWLSTVKDALNLGAPMITLGTGVGSCGFQDGVNVDVAPWLPSLERFKAVGVRGPRSKAALSAIGFDRAEVIGDMALYLTEEKPTLARPDPCVALNVALPSDGGSAQYANSLEDLRRAVGLLCERGWTICPLAMNASDIEPTEQLLRSAGLDNLPVRLLQTTTEFFDFVRPCRFIIAVRLHAAILACCTGVPPLMLGYRDKCLDFMESMNLAEWNIDFHSPGQDQICDRALALAEGADNLRPLVHERAMHWKSEIGSYLARNLQV